MRICYVANLASIHTQRWVRYFAHRGHEVHVITPERGSAEHAAGIHVHAIGSVRAGSMTLTLALNSLLAAPSIARYRRLLGRIRPDLVHAHYLNDAALFAMAAGVHPFVGTAWGSDVLLAPRASRLIAAGLRTLLRGCDLVTCDAEHVKAALLRLGADRRKVEVVFFGTDTEEFHPGRRRAELRNRLGWGERPVIISTRRLEPIYDLGSLLAAIPLVARQVPSAQWVIAGGGSDGPRLQGMAHSLGVSAQVAFVGEIAAHALPEWLASADIYVSTALSDGGLAASTAEAMASGLPVIVTDVADNQQWITDSVTGFLVPPSNAEAIAGRIIRLLNDQALRRAVGENARRVIDTRNNWRVQMDRMEHLYLRLAAGH